MEQLKRRHIRRADRIADRLENQLSEVVKPYLVTEDDIMMRAGKFVLEDHIMMVSQETIKDDLLPRRANYFVYEDNLIFRAEGTIRDDILKGTRKDYWIIEDNVMIFADPGIRDDVLRKSGGSWIIEDDVMIQLAGDGVRYLAPVRQAPGQKGMRTLALLGQVSDDRSLEKSWVGLLQAETDERGIPQKMHLADSKGKQLAEAAFKLNMIGEGSPGNPPRPETMAMRVSLYIDGEYWGEYEVNKFFWHMVKVLAGS